MEVCHTGQCVTIFGGAARISEVPHGTRHLELHQPPDRSAAPTRSMWSLVSPGRDLFGGVSAERVPHFSQLWRGEVAILEYVEQIPQCRRRPGAPAGGCAISCNCCQRTPQWKPPECSEILRATDLVRVPRGCRIRRVGWPRRTAGVPQEPRPTSGIAVSSSFRWCRVCRGCRV